MPEVSVAVTVTVACNALLPLMSGVGVTTADTVGPFRSITIPLKV